MSLVSNGFSNLETVLWRVKEDGPEKVSVGEEERVGILFVQLWLTDSERATFLSIGISCEEDIV